MDNSMFKLEFLLSFSQKIFDPVLHDGHSKYIMYPGPLGRIPIQQQVDQIPHFSAVGVGDGGLLAIHDLHG